MWTPRRGRRGHRRRAGASEGHRDDAAVLQDAVLQQELALLSGHLIYTGVPALLPPSKAEAGPNLATGALATPSTEDDEPAGPTVGELASGEAPDTEVQEGESPSVPPIGEKDIEELTAESLFDPAATSRIVILWILTPSLSVVGSYLLFALLL